MADVERITPSSRDGDGTVRRRSSRSCTIIAQEKVAAAAAAAAAAASVTKSFLSSSALVKADSKTIQGETDQQKERRALRSMWELACVINFLNVFRSVVKIRTGFRADELETSLMNPNGLIKDLHIDLLKGIPPLPRVPIDKNNWAAVLCAKLRDRWSQVSDGVCPLMAAKGEEEAAYNALNAAARLRILRAVCEMRLDTDDVRGAMDETIKQGEPPSSFQLQPVAVDNSGCTYWYEDDETVGSRLYREIPPVLSKSKTRGLGRRAPPPAAPIWETIATNVEEFHEIGERLSNSRNKPEAKLGKYIFEDLLPCLEERERKREKAAKKQQRQQLLLQSIMNGVGLAAGRSRRERKIVSYTFEEFDKSINEAIKWTNVEVIIGGGWSGVVMEKAGAGGTGRGLVMGVEALIVVKHAREEVSKRHVGFVGEGGCEVFVAYSFDAGDERKVENDNGGEVMAEGADVLDETVRGTRLAEVAELFKVGIDGFLGAEGGRGGRLEEAEVVDVVVEVVGVEEVGGGVRLEAAVDVGVVVVTTWMEGAVVWDSRAVDVGTIVDVGVVVVTTVIVGVRCSIEVTRLDRPEILASILVMDAWMSVWKEDIMRMRVAISMATGSDLCSPVSSRARLSTDWVLTAVISMLEDWAMLGEDGVDAVAEATTADEVEANAAAAATVAATSTAAHWEVLVWRGGMWRCSGFMQKCCAAPPQQIHNLLYDLQQLYVVHEDLFSSLGVSKESFEHPTAELASLVTSTLWTLFTARANEPIRKRQRLNMDMPRSANWDLPETLALVRAKREESYEILREPEGSPPRPSRERWAFIILKLQSWGVDRDVRTCVRRWENLARYYRKVFMHEHFSGRPSFWTLSFTERKMLNMPFQLERRVYDEMDEFMGFNNPLVISPTRVLAICDREASPCNSDSYGDNGEGADRTCGDGGAMSKLWIDVWKPESMAQTPDRENGGEDSPLVLPTPDRWAGAKVRHLESSPSPDGKCSYIPDGQQTTSRPNNSANNLAGRRLGRRRRLARKRRRTPPLSVAFSDLTTAVLSGGAAFANAFLMAGDRQAKLAAESLSVVDERRQVILESNTTVESGQRMLLSVLQGLNTTLNSMIWSISRPEQTDEQHVCGLGLVVGVAAGGTSTPCNLVPFATPGVIRRGSADRNGHSAREVTQAERPKSRNVRPRVSSSQYGDQFVHIDEVEEEDEFGDDDIEGEAIYDDEYLEIRRRQLNALKMSTPVKRRAGRNGGLRRGPDSDDEDYKCGSIRARTGEQRRYNFRDGYSVHRLRQCSIVDDLQWGMKRSSRRRSGSEDENEGRPRGRNNRFLEDNNHHIAEARDFFGNGDFCDGELRGDEGGMQADSGDLSEDGYQSDGMTEDMGRRENGGAVLFEEDESTDAFEDRGRGVKRRRLADLSLGRNARERSRRVQVNHERAERGIFDTGSTRSSGRLNVLKGHITGPDRVACRTFEEVHYGYRLGEGVPRSNGTCDEMEEDGGAEEDYLERTEVRERDFAVGNSDSMQDDDGDSDEQGD
ncbi:hypothetical protein CBR_g48718 [Chara braunii]|uniref:Myb-like domain-containing protein n=1 Tax=Chara braunii TaxID=69332 RepID=A0A388K4M8_CHABU|nr:hypothetical protein CBR_g48718 [Chara braunii]|eukprot:GBG64969.1 hypothetical protein CBR_g48718 [Chara braunii]